MSGNHRNFLKILENVGISRHFSKNIGISRNFLKIIEISGNFSKIRGILKIFISRGGFSKLGQAAGPLNPIGIYWNLLIPLNFHPFPSGAREFIDFCDFCEFLDPAGATSFFWFIAKERS